mmetsp:Transcript_8906/g.19610  ORF Transcript_8906/g.19610 Transcript_8906/m.19610 type:complete len:95 (+) Transcript_8906:2038-2322(+)
MNYDAMVKLEYSDRVTVAVLIFHPFCSKSPSNSRHDYGSLSPPLPVHCRVFLSKRLRCCRSKLDERKMIVRASRRKEGYTRIFVNADMSRHGEK